MPLSNFALIMPFYKYTLKDLLEKCIDKKGYLSAPDLSRSCGGAAETAAVKGGDAAEKRGAHTDRPGKEVSQMTTKKRENGGDSSTPNEGDDADGRTWWNPTGYEILAEQSFDHRITTMMPYVRRIADGLCALHAARLTHLDPSQQTSSSRRRESK